MREYDQIAEWFTAARNPKIGIPDLVAFTAALPSRAKILDLGCGDGIPISQFLLQEGFDLVGLDSSSEMIERFRARFPAVDTRCERAQDAEFAPEIFEAVVTWGMLFHLAAADQKALMMKVEGWLKPGGRFLFTSGDVEERVTGEMNGVAFEYISLGSSTYRRMLKEASMHVVEEYSDLWDNHVYVAEKGHI